ncbi:acetyl-CoA carboxylase carboxyltransferase subunit [Spirilliplanes yamanashiensis]|uniref:Acetyl-CoA carboxylase carboxyltransferase subunit n=2 Tax=Spirilliplanes yamanashiensis TaxID=42233 RepID=A0A8J3Y6K3_9ACTN|nr:acetyl-CoA carboxylase carboxyltransferase subunit [Spirilliplanes yamanashiensis]
MLERLADLESALEAARAGGGEKNVTRHHARGKLLPRERVELLLDQDAPFLELSPVAAWGTEFPVGASVVTGVGVVEGVECVVVAHDPTVHGGAVNPFTDRKVRRAAEIAAANRLPLLTMVESTGSGSPAPGAVAAELARHRVPTVCVVFGPTSGDAVYLPALSDQLILVGPQARVQLSQQADGQHDGLADFVAEDERDGIRLARLCVRRLNWRKLGPAPRSAEPVPPRHEMEDLLTIAGSFPAGPFEAREVLARVLDGSVFDEFKPGYGPELVCGWGEVHGYPVAVLAVGGSPASAEARKGAHFVQLANASATPLVELRHPGNRAAAGGDVSSAALLVNALANSVVPRLAVTLGEGVREPGHRFGFRWPSNPLPVGLVPSPGGGDAPKASAAMYASGHLHDDGVIDPRDTRTVLGICLSAVHSGPIGGAASYGVFRV